MSNLISISDLQASQITRHPVSACQPDLDPEALAALRESVRRNGIRQPIEIIAGREEAQVVDGWNRLQALLDVRPALHAQNTECLHVLSTEECEPERLAQLVDGLLRGRRHLTKKQLADQQVAIWEACGMSLATPGGKREKRKQNPTPKELYDPSAQNEHLPQEGVITAEKVAAAAGVSTATARRSISDAKAEKQQESDPKPDIAGERRKARASAKASSKLSERDELRGQLRFWRRTAQDAGKDLDAMRLEIAGDPVTRQEEIDKLRLENAALEDRATKAEAQVKYWQKMSSRLESALERLHGGEA